MRLYKIRKLVHPIFHDSNNAAFTFGILYMYMFACCVCGNHALRKRMPVLQASVWCLPVDVPDRSCMMVECIRVKRKTCNTYIGCLRIHYTDNIT